VLGDSYYGVALQAAFWLAASCLSVDSGWADIGKLHLLIDYDGIRD
jgi:hypothetical protein